MRARLILILLIASVIFAFTQNGDENTITARKLMKDFGKELKSELMKGMKSGGQTGAIEACNSQAPIIAQELSDSTGWKIGRTSLRVRNSDTTPDDWEKTVLENFETQFKSGEDIKTLEFTDTVKIDGSEYFRYMKAIPTSTVCLNCHGSNIKDSIKEKISQLYKKDKAINFEKGDIRGAFTLSKKIN